MKYSCPKTPPSAKRSWNLRSCLTLTDWSLHQNKIHFSCVVHICILCLTAIDIEVRKWCDCCSLCARKWNFELFTHVAFPPKSTDWRTTNIYWHLVKNDWRKNLKSQQNVLLFAAKGRLAIIVRWNFHAHSLPLAPQLVVNPKLLDIGGTFLASMWKNKLCVECVRFLLQLWGADSVKSLNVAMLSDGTNVQLSVCFFGVK